MIIILGDSSSGIGCGQSDKIFDFCKDCGKMAGAFAAKKVRENMEKNAQYHTQEPDAMHYSSKYMNSIWGLYNRFSVHNLKKIMEDNQAQVMGPAVNKIAESSKLSVSMERLIYSPL